MTAMTSRLTPSGALDELGAQHALLREMMERCESRADDVDADTGNPAQRLDEVARLRTAFDAHNQFEEQLLRPLLLDVDWRPRAMDLAGGGCPAPPWPEGTPAGMGAVRVSRMALDHVQEHRAMRIGLGATPTSELRGVLAELRAHLESEERYFLSRKVLRDDLA